MIFLLAHTGTLQVRLLLLLFTFVPSKVSLVWQQHIAVLTSTASTNSSVDHS